MFDAICRMMRGLYELTMLPSDKRGSKLGALLYRWLQVARPMLQLPHAQP
jgi:hypothetical protein